MKISTCCGCCSLQKGSIIVGVIASICSAIGLVGSSIMLHKIENHHDNEFRMSNYWPVKSLVVAIICTVILGFIVTIVFFIGTVKRKANYVFPFVCMAIGHSIPNLGICIGHIVFACGVLTGFGILLVIIIFTILYIMTLYMTLIVFSFYKELVAEERGHFDNRGNLYKQPLGQDV